jgi:hypothetical protein
MGQSEESVENTERVLSFPDSKIVVNIKRCISVFISFFHFIFEHPAALM